MANAPAKSAVVETAWILGIVRVEEPDEVEAGALSFLLRVEELKVGGNRWIPSWESARILILALEGLVGCFVWTVHATTFLGGRACVRDKFADFFGCAVSWARVF